MRLVLFDIDGTLTDTKNVDTACFARALADVFGVSNVNTDWSAYPEATDSALVAHIVEDQLGRRPREQEIARMRSRFHALLDAAFADSAACRAVRGGTEFLVNLSDRPDCAVAYATGGWGSTARLKLRIAGYADADLPMASADDALRRVDICSIAAQRAFLQHGATVFRSKVYVGDGVWDARAAAELGYRFVGVATGRNADLLRQEGAAAVVPDFDSTSHEILLRQLLH